MRLLVFFNFLAIAGADFSSHCREDLAVGRRTIRRDASRIARAEIEFQRKNYLNALRDLTQLVASRPPMRMDGEDASPATPPPCPAPNATMFTTQRPTQPPPPPTNPATSPVAVMTTTEGAESSTQETTANQETAVSSDASPTTEQQTTPTSTNGPVTDENNKEENFDDDSTVFHSPSVYVADHQLDPFATQMNRLFNYVSSPSEVCNGPPFSDLNSLTEHQLYGFFSNLATAHPGPFCSLCDRFVSEVREKLFTPSQLMLDPDELHMSRLLFSQIPSAKGLCSAIAPACYDGYEEKVKNITKAVDCLECSGCMSITNIIQHKVLLQPAVVQSFLAFLRSSLFHNICAELCPLFSPPNNFTLFPNGFTYDGCQNWFTGKYEWFIRFATVVTRPERLCSLELGWCQLNEVPNMLNCLRELCEEELGSTAQAVAICSIIPGDPEKADAFLNIKRTKTEREKKRKEGKREGKEHDEL